MTTKAVTFAAFTAVIKDYETAAAAEVAAYEVYWAKVAEADEACKAKEVAEDVYYEACNDKVAAEVACEEALEKA